MYTTKSNVQYVISLLKAYGIRHIVLSPGSRNVPFIHSFSQDKDFTCYTHLDERSAGFFALGLIQALQQPVVICCTSGTAMLNYGPAVAEAFYQPLPLFVISADRAQAWIGQMDGQTVVQADHFKSITTYCAQLPEIANEQDRWYCQRLLHEALLKITQEGAGPVHINVPISEPFFDFSATTLPRVSAIQQYSCSALSHVEALTLQWQRYPKKMLVLGQYPKDEQLKQQLVALANEHQCVIAVEHLANQSHPDFISLTDLCLAVEDKVEQPQLVIYCGGHLVSKRLKQLLRKHPPRALWHVTHESAPLIDLFQALTVRIDAPLKTMLNELLKLRLPVSKEAFQYYQYWQQLFSRLRQQLATYEFPFSDMFVVQQFLRCLPEKCHLQLGNSSSVRYAQFFTLPANVVVNCNRGTSGIDGSVSTAVGYATGVKELTFLVIGDLSFFYDVNVLWQSPLPANLRILLLNNRGGAIFHMLPGLNQSPALQHYIAAGHDRSGKKWVDAAELLYLSAHDKTSYLMQLEQFVDTTETKGMVLEVFTQAEQANTVLTTMINTLKKKDDYDNTTRMATN